MTNQTQTLLTIKEAADYLNVKESHLRSLIFKREIPFIKIGRLIRFDFIQLENWLQQHGAN